MNVGAIQARLDSAGTTSEGLPARRMEALLARPAYGCRKPVVAPDLVSPAGPGT
jgi:hypothetical protein